MISFKKPSKTLISIGLIGLLLGAPLVQAEFEDIETNPYSESIQYYQDKHVIEGFSSGTKFRPDEPITLAAFLKILLVNYGFNPKNNPAPRLKAPFRDISGEEWFAPYFQRAWEIGLLEDAAQANPGKAINRIEAGELALKLLKVHVPLIADNESWPIHYKDVNSEAWFAPIVLYARAYDLFKAIDSNDSTYFKPYKAVTRGEATQILYNIDVYLYGEEVLYNLGDQLLDSSLNFTIPHLDTFLSVWNRVNNQYYQAAEINQEELIYGAIKGMIEALGDPPSIFFDPSEAGEFEEGIEGEFGGIGAYLDETQDGIRVNGFVSESPAENSGLEYNDIIVAVDGVSVTEKTKAEAVTMIRGEVGTPVVLTVQREGSAESLEFTIIRALIDVGKLEGKMMEKAMVIDMNTFNEEGGEEFEATVNSLMKENPDTEGFILDLRDNSGGYVTTAVKILEHFIPAGAPVLYYTMNGALGMLTSEGEGEWGNYPMVILINKGSASASEIVALALKEKTGAKIVGTTSYGKGTVQGLFHYKDEAELKLTIAEWLSPEMTGINGIGIVPDEMIERTPEDIDAQKDPQLEKALEIFEELTNQ